jgi:YVTN family beta-propeller protein
MGSGPKGGEVMRKGGWRLGATVSIGAAVAAVAMGFATSASAGSLSAYVTNTYGDSVTPIDVATNTAGSAIPAGPNPYGIAITPDGATAYVANNAEPGPSVTPIDLATNTAGPAIPVGGFATEIAVSPDDRTAYVVTDTNGGFPTSVTPIDVATDTAGNPINLDPSRGSAIDVAITPDSQTAYVAANRDPLSGTVTPITLATRHVGTAIQLPGPGVESVAVTPDGSTVWALSISPPNDTLTPIDVHTNTVGTAISVAANVGCQGFAALAITPDGRKAYVSDPCANLVVPVDLVTQTVGTPIPMGAYGIAITPDGSTAYAANLAGVTPIDLATNTAGTPIPTGAYALHVAITPEPRRSTSTAVVCSHASVVIGLTTTCEAKVTDTDAGTPVTPVGPVAFTTNRRGTFAPNPCYVSGTARTATCKITYTPTTAAGQHTLTASYAGDARHSPSSGQTAIQVLARATTTTLSCQQNLLSVGQSTVCTATVTDTAPGTATTPTGTVRMDGHTIDSFTGSPCTLAGSGASSSCQITYTPLAAGPGQHTITAYYSGGGTHSPSHGQTTITVTPPSTS